MMMLMLKRRVLRIILPPQPTKPHSFLTAHMKIYIMYNTAHQNLGRPLFVFWASMRGSNTMAFLAHQHSTYTPTHTYPPTHT
jgi:hypothetical protein